MDIRRVRADAYVYYDGLTDDKKRAVEGFFQELDADESGDISIGEFKYFLRRAGFQSEDLTWLFEELDENNDGALDFQALLTFFYMLGQEEFRELMNAPPINNGFNGRRRPVDQEGRGIGTDW